MQSQKAYYEFTDKSPNALQFMYRCVRVRVQYKFTCQLGYILFFKIFYKDFSVTVYHNAALSSGPNDTEITYLCHLHTPMPSHSVCK